MQNNSKKSGWRRALHDPVFFAREYLGFDPHPGQTIWLQKSTGRENALVTGNRWGKSEIQAVKLIHRSVFQLRPIGYDRPGRYRALNVSITLDQAQIIFDKIIGLLERGRKIKSLIKNVKSTPYSTIFFRNGSELSARTSANRGEHLLGHDYDFVNFDEVAYEPQAEAVVEGVLKMRLADRTGRLDLCSTPNGYNWFYHRCELIRKSGRGFVYHGPTAENHHLPREALDYLRKNMSPARAAQHLDGRFAAFEGRLLNEETIRAALARGAGKQTAASGRRFVHGWDLARKQTFTVGVVLDCTRKPYQLVHIERYQRDWPEIVKRIHTLHEIYGGQIVIDSTGIGDVILSSLKDLPAKGFNFAGGNREKLLANLERAFMAGDLGIFDERLACPDGDTWSLVDELRALDCAYETAGDGVCALALALWGAESDDKLVLPALVGLGRIE